MHVVIIKDFIYEKLDSVTPGCGIQESQGLQLAQMKFELNNSSQCTIIPNLIPRYNNEKIGLCTSHATCCGSQV